MPVLHSYLTVDTDGFLARPERLRAFVEIAVNMFNEDMEENDQVHAAKLLECLILECQVCFRLLSIEKGERLENPSLFILNYKFLKFQI